MKRLIAIAVTLAALTTACTESGPQPIGPAPGVGSESPSSSGSPVGSPSPSPSPDPTRSTTYEIWFHYDGHLFVTHRTELFTEGVGTRAIEILLGGPTSAETTAGVDTAITPGTDVLSLHIRDGVATVNLSGQFTSQETPAIAVGSLSQIVYTLTQFDSIDGVRFEVDGTPLTNFGGYELDGTQQSGHDRGHRGRVRGGRVHPDLGSERRHGGVHIHDGDVRDGMPRNLHDRCPVRCRYSAAGNDPRLRGERDGRLTDPRRGDPRHADAVNQDLHLLHDPSRWSLSSSGSEAATTI